MTDHDHERFAQVLQVLAEAMGETLAPARVAIYFKVLSRFEIEALERAAYIHIERSKFFPKPAELIELIEGTIDDKAVLAWSRTLRAIETVGTYESVDFGDAILHATITAMGGWTEAWRWERMDSKEQGYLRHQFCVTYEALTRQPPDMGWATRPLIGQAEGQNRLTRATWARGHEHEEVILAIGPDGRVIDRRAIGAAGEAMEKA